MGHWIIVVELGFSHAVALVVSRFLCSFYTHSNYNRTSSVISSCPLHRLIPVLIRLWRRSGADPLLV
ncbi:hypothetical protein JAAARDRAFT_651963 [Jaapia argillacea MUCL 33604]|uniref:Uncharacterized protein n=1 Tax=Jaapia argillacea MUCL 33604 TaxID=933084 RepID=A0A067Q6H7_9AGAM|nr:hypothetical protein JAAARDRAFT_651963 [Jaapia argillacea MUCL 33604]